jgi:hypothetical protein
MNDDALLRILSHLPVVVEYSTAASMHGRGLYLAPAHFDCRVSETFLCAGNQEDPDDRFAVSVIALLDNGLEAPAITGFAGPSWSGRALGVQNTAQRLMAAVAIPLFGTLIGGVSISADMGPVRVISAARNTVGADSTNPGGHRIQIARPAIRRGCSL